MYTWFIIMYFSCCGAGTAADTEYVTNLISSHIQLHSLSTGRQVKYVLYWVIVAAAYCSTCAV